jgi:hypothetical protein
MPTSIEVPERLEVRLPAGTNARLRDLAGRETISVGALVRRAIRLLLADADCDRQEERVP